MTITEKTIDDLADKLEEAVNYIKSGKKPDERWLKDMDWLIYDVRKASEQRNYEFEDDLVRFSH